ncbi:piggyBac transposable element-derived protein 4-like [Maniola jurtina]|uniref:piggyBac transposable element-derived protein 4-like n=1 Tax=Maniola jurtina TaxID=191418 RepID=UPI001E68E098|nr:piggyBac transposable element-derived protein 4-like [Maniola jurtina]
MTKPNVIDEIDVVNIETYPRGVPRESPLHVKRRRTWNPLSDVAGPSRPPSNWVFQSIDEMEVPSQHVTEMKVQVEAHRQNAAPLFILEEVDAAAAATTVHSLSPAVNIDCDSGSPPQRPLFRPRSNDALTQKQKKYYSQYGSESESEQSEDEEPLIAAPRLTRVHWAAMETPLDEPESVPVDESEPIPVELLSSPAAPSTLPPTATPSLNQGATMAHDFFAFKWKKFCDLPELLERDRREPFSHVGVGPTTPCEDGYQIFTSIWDKKIMNHIAMETNRYAQEVAWGKMVNHKLGPHSRICSWQDTTPDELYTYMAIILAMGNVIKTKLEEYWSTNADIFSTPGFSACMPYNRFVLLNACIHFANNGAMDAEKLTPSEAKLYKIELIVTHLNDKFQSLYNLGQNIALDESLLQWKARLSINQFTSNKAATIGIKTYEICESKTGYLWRFVIHAHKATSAVPLEQQTPLDAPTPAIVLGLLNGLQNKGHTVWMDNYYNSPALARYLKSIGFDVVGTLRTNREFVASDLVKLTKSNMKPGEISSCTSGDVDLMVWRDNNRVGTISTYHGNATVISDGKLKPVLIVDYNIMMGGVDKKDQMLAMYPVERKRTKVWYKKFFRRLLNVSVLNSYIIAKNSSPRQDHRTFRHDLILALLSRHNSNRKIVFPPNRGLDIAPPTTFEASVHNLAKQPIGNSASRLRRKCCECKKRTHFYCVGCNKPVCIGACFISLHTV